jgi:hypothetical protein
MTSYEFEVAAKNAVIKTIRQRYGEDYIIGDIQTVWFAHVLGYKKAIMIDNGPNLRLYEVTYNKHQNELYVDAYVKESNDLIVDIDPVVHK